MPDTPTENYAWIKPEIGGSDDTWGAKLNAIFDAIDAKMKEVEDFLPNKILPVGSILVTDKTGNPATWLGFGTWVPASVGRAIVGVGTASGEQWTIGAKKGTAEHTLSIAELPNHDHVVSPPTQRFHSNYDGEHWHFIRDMDDKPVAAGSNLDSFRNNIGNDNDVRTTTTGNHRHYVDVNLNAFTSGKRGGGNAHNNIQPSEARFVWKRTE